MTEETVHGTVIATRPGIYSVYVIKCDDNSLRMYTLLRNWGVEYCLNIGDTGYFTLQYYTAGEKYYNRNTDDYQIIKFTNVYFKDFIKDNKQHEKIIL